HSTRSAASKLSAWTLCPAHALSRPRGVVCPCWRWEAQRQPGKPRRHRAGELSDEQEGGPGTCGGHCRTDPDRHRWVCRGALSDQLARRATRRVESPRVVTCVVS